MWHLHPQKAGQPGQARRVSLLDDCGQVGDDTLVDACFLVSLATFKAAPLTSLLDLEEISHAEGVPVLAPPCLIM